jgi:phage-related protein
MGRTVGYRTIEIEVFFTQVDRTLATAKVRQLANWLNVESPKSLVFSDEPDKQYFVVLSGDTQIEELYSQRKAKLTFIAPDPFAYAVAETQTPFTLGANALTNSGTASVFPRFLIPLTGDVSYLKVKKSDTEFVLVGQIDDASLTPVAPTTNVLSDDLSSVTGWSVGTHNIGGSVAGTMVSDGANFGAQLVGGSYGAGASWHGPVLRKACSSTAADFQVDVTAVLTNVANPYLHITSEAKTMTGTAWQSLAHANTDGTKVANLTVKSTDGKHTYSSKRDFDIQTSAGVTQIRRKASGSKITSGQSVKVNYDYLVGKCGRCVAYVLDSNGAQIGYVNLYDASPTGAATRVDVVVNGHTLLAGYQGPIANAYNNFSGLMRLSRKGGLWTFYICQIDGNGRAFNESTTTWKDTGTLAPLGMVELETSQYGSWVPVPAAYFTAANAIKFNDTATSPIIIATTGDIIEIDCNTAAVRKNGVPFMQYLDLKSTFFPIEPSGVSVEFSASNPGNVDPGNVETDDTGAPVAQDGAYVAVRPRWL